MKLNKRGDTIVEVLLSTVILSIVLAGAYSLSSRATRLNQSSYERTRASNLVQEQAELIRAIYQEDASDWLTLSVTQNYEEYYDCRNPQSPIPPDVGGSSNGGIFYLESTPTGPVIHEGEFLTSNSLYNTWAARSTDNNDYYDFYIYSCWEGLSSAGHQVSGAVVRLGRQ